MLNKNAAKIKLRSLGRLVLTRRMRIWIARPKPISFFLFLLMIAIIIPSLSISVLLLKRNDSAQRAVVTTLAEAMSGSIAQAVDRELGGMITTLRVLSTSPFLATKNYDIFYERARLALAGSGSYLILVDKNLKQILNTRLPLGTDLDILPDTSSVQNALSSRTAIVSGVTSNQGNNSKYFTVQLPYVDENNDVFILVLAQDTGKIAEELTYHLLGGGWNAALIDRKGAVIASSLASLTVGEPFFMDIPSDRRGHDTTVNYLGKNESFFTIVDKSDYSGWNVVAWSPNSAIRRPIQQALWQLLAGSLIIIAFGTAAALFIGNQIAMPVRRLARDARKLGAGEPVRSIQYPIAEMATVSSALASAARNRDRAENEIRLLMREVAHRSKNQLTVVSSMAKQTARHARSLPVFLDSFQKRLYGLARSTDLLLAGGVAGVNLNELLIAQIDPFKPDDEKRLMIKGPSFTLSIQAAQSIGMAIHELATNASKYGAFSSDKGELQVTWKITNDTLILKWKEYARSSRRREPTRRGFGTEIIERMIKGALNAKIERKFDASGLVCIFEIPISRVMAEPLNELKVLQY